MSDAPIDGGQGTLPPSPPAGAPPAPADPPAPPAAPVPWLPGADDLTVGYVQNKGWKEPSQMLDSYRGLEKLMGADRAGHTVTIPKEGAPPEEWNAFYNRLGRPTEAAGYKLQVPDGAPKEFAEAASAKMHELGLPQKMGEALGAWWNEWAQTTNQQQMQQAQDQAANEDRELRAEWGKAFDQEVVKAQAAARGLGVDEKAINALQQVLGYKATMQFFNKIGSKIGEPDFATGTSPERFGSAMTPPQAMARIAELKADKGFVAKLMSKDTDAKAEWARLHSFAYPEEAK